MKNKNKKYDLQAWAAVEAERIRDFCLKLPMNIANGEYIRQLIGWGSSPGANYIEANESIGDKDFNMKLRPAGVRRKSHPIG